MSTLELPESSAFRKSILNSTQLLLNNVTKKIKFNKLLGIRWKWRRTRVYNLIYASNHVNILLVIVFLHCCCAPITIFTNSQEVVSKEEYISNVWNELSPNEVRHIFGKSFNKINKVPNLDIITPQIFHRKIRRKRNISINSPIKSHAKSNHNNYDDENFRNPYIKPASENDDEKHSNRKIIKLSGLGRDFTLQLSLNHNLINFNEFVHLFRGENHSEIRSDDIVKRQLHCFHQGSVEHYNTQENSSPSDKNEDDDDVNHRMKSNRRSNLNIPKYGRVAIDICNGLKGIILPSDNDPQHHYVIHPLPKRLHENVTLMGQRNNAQTPKHFIWRIPTEESQANSKSNCGHAHSQNQNHDTPKIRLKRSHVQDRASSYEDFVEDDDDATSDSKFYYKPRNVAADSYWYRHRTTVSPLNAYSYNNNNYKNAQHGQPTKEIKQILSASSHETIIPFSNYKNPNYAVPRSNNENDKVFSRNRQNKNFNEPYQFYKRNSAENVKLDATKAITPASHLWSPSYGLNYTSINTRTLTPPALPSTGSGHGYFNKDYRKGRGDDRIFNGNWHSSLDSDLMNTAHSILSQAKVLHKDKEPSHLTIETAVFVDKDLYKHMELNFPDDSEAEITRIVLAMINAVQLLYQDPSLGHRVDFVLKRLEILTTDPPGLIRPYDIDRFLTNFCKWQKTENPISDSDPLHWDHALILTGLDLYVVHQSGKISNQVVGLAPVAGMCTRSSSCTVNEGRHFESVFVIAHEIGHNLGMRHDAADNECDPTHHIMSPTLGSGKITWSSCSKRYLDMFLDTSQSKCLLDQAVPEARLDHELDKRLPGERFSADRQCVLKYGRGSYHSSQQPMEDVCRDLHCRREHYTWTSHPALEGTSCGIDMSCRAGKCVQKQSSSSSISINSIEQTLLNYNHLNADGNEIAAYSALVPLDGGWGIWSPFTDCSSACLVSSFSSADRIESMGVRLAARRCDNPRPENGGRQCSGQDRRYKTCSIEKLCPASSSVTVGQYANEVCKRAAVVDTDLSGRGFMTNTNDPERSCSVWCETSQRSGSRSRGWSFPDGTSCKLASHPSGNTYCIAGKCQEFTCDKSTHFQLSDETCKVQQYGNSVYKPNNNWVSTTANDGPIAASDLMNYNTHLHGHGPSWTKWESQSTCKLTCLAPSKGLELVERKCDVNEPNGLCSGLSISVRLCKPDKHSIIANGCTRLQTAFEYATRVCTKYSEKVSGLSGIGMQLSPTKEDADRPCKIGCQDKNLPYRFYMVNGEDGWFPAGTDCSRGEPNRKSYCISGKCVEFGSDDTPVYKIQSKLYSGIEALFLRRGKRATTSSTMNEFRLKQLIQHFVSSASQRNGNSSKNGSLDFSNPVTMLPNEFANNVSNLIKSSSPLIVEEGGFYEWRKIVSDCSVNCGTGLQEVIVECVSGETVVPDSYCDYEKKPGTSSYVQCVQRLCTKSDLQATRERNSMRTWIKSIIPPN